MKRLLIKIQPLPDNLSVYKFPSDSCQATKDINVKNRNVNISAAISDRGLILYYEDSSDQRASTP